MYVKKEIKMKTIFSIIIALIIFGFVVGNKASAQPGCEVCIAPSLCYILTFDLQGCQNVQAILCYRCGVTRPEVYVELVQISNICPGFFSQVLDYVEDWVLEHLDLLCGNVPCNEQRITLTLVRPICGKVTWNGERHIVEEGGANCNLKCYEIWEWCYCFCTPDFWDEKCPNPHAKYNITQYWTEGNGTCEEPYPPPGESRECAKLTDRNCGQLP